MPRSSAMIVHVTKAMAERSAESCEVRRALLFLQSQLHGDVRRCFRRQNMHALLRSMRGGASRDYLPMFTDTGSVGKNLPY